MVFEGFGFGLDVEFVWEKFYRMIFKLLLMLIALEIDWMKIFLLFMWVKFVGIILFFVRIDDFGW